MEIVLILLYLAQLSVVIGNLSSGNVFKSKTSFWLNLIPFYYLIYIYKEFLGLFKECFKDSFEEYKKLD